ncbi:hypothetical protein HDA40_001009 [Hamadaea flava]|uniref:Uncharacterized protein n=1 Tax=Hamadaea flava TaxID=1742688 RepID=A0ABV8LRB9_9ACTN|nr:hypothetical protein [Hamadaea flava]MCP2322502.1 hypothetical protein [Hamadaea flava]
MSDTTRASLPEVALGSAVLAADTARDLVKRAAYAGIRTVSDTRDAAVDQVQTRVRAIARAVAPGIIDELMPYLTSSVLPRFLDAALPLIEAKLLPRLMESAMPLIEERMMPRLMESALPLIEKQMMPGLLDAAIPLLQDKVVPLMIKDLTESEELRELITEQSRDVVADAAGDLRDSTAAADDRLEIGFRRLFHLSSSASAK